MASTSKPLVTPTGTASDGLFGPSLGRVDIGSNDGAYVFRIALPGVRGADDTLKCNIDTSGRVDIEGVISGSQFAKTSSKAFQMEVQQLCPPGPFTMSFTLPGPVDPRLSTISFKPGGILEGVAFKSRVPQLAADGTFQKWYDCLD